MPTKTVFCVADNGASHCISDGETKVAGEVVTVRSSALGRGQNVQLEAAGWKLEPCRSRVIPAVEMGSAAGKTDVMIAGRLELNRTSVSPTSDQAWPSWRTWTTA